MFMSRCVIREYPLPSDWKHNEPFEIQMDPYAQFLDVLYDTGSILVREESEPKRMSRRFVACKAGPMFGSPNMTYLGHFVSHGETTALFALFRLKN